MRSLIEYLFKYKNLSIPAFFAASSLLTSFTFSLTLKQNSIVEVVSLQQEKNTFNLSECGWLSYKKQRKIEALIVAGIALKPQLLIENEPTQQQKNCQPASVQQQEIEELFFKLYHLYCEITETNIDIAKKELPEKVVENTSSKLELIDGLIAEISAFKNEDFSKIVSESYALQAAAYLKAVHFAGLISRIGFLQQMRESLINSFALNKENTRSAFLHALNTVAMPPNSISQLYIAKNFKKIIKNNEKQVEVFNSHLMLSQLYINFRNSAQAEIHLNKAKSIYPNSPVLKEMMRRALLIKRVY